MSDELMRRRALNLGDRRKIVERYEARCACVKCDVAIVKHL